MAGLEAPPSPQPALPGFLAPLAREQYAALVWVQSRIFLNSLRTMRGSFELGARIVMFLLFGAIAIGPAIGMGFGAWVAAAHNRLLGISILLWVLFLMWQFFSALAPALAGQNPELSHLLRYPVSFGSWILLYLVYGIAAPSTLIGLLWTAAIGIGITVGRPDVFAWTFLTMVLFAGFNLLLSRMILAWIERWMAQRRTREIVTAILLFAALGAQALNPAFHQNLRGPALAARKQTITRIADRFSKLQKVFPPGLATDSIVQAMRHRKSQETEALGWLVIYSAAAAGLLAVRLRAESRGENLGEAPRRSSSARTRTKSRTRALLDFSGPIAAVFEKDLRYLMRSGPMLYNLAAPLVMVVVFGGAMRGGKLSGVRAEYALPIGMAWAFLGLTRLICNNLGTEGEGIQFFFMSPTPMRTVVLGKNFLHFVLFLLEVALISTIVIFRFGLPAPSIIAATLAWLLFAIPANFAVGNLLSINMPYRVNMARIRREPGAVGNGLTSMVTQFGILIVGALVLMPCAFLGRVWLATPIFLVLAAISSFVYLRVLGNVDSMVQSHMESLTLEVMKTS
jgi:ABC-2 type transport system permease protein